MSQRACLIHPSPKRFQKNFSARCGTRAYRFHFAPLTEPFSFHMASRSHAWCHANDEDATAIAVAEVLEEHIDFIVGHGTYIYDGLDMHKGIDIPKLKRAEGLLRDLCLLDSRGGIFFAEVHARCDAWAGEQRHQ